MRKGEMRISENPLFHSGHGEFMSSTTGTTVRFSHLPYLLTNETHFPAERLLVRGSNHRFKAKTS